MIANVITALFALLLTAGQAPPPDPTVEDHVRVLSSEAEVQFPDEIVFQLTAESEDRITGIRLHYRFVNLSTTSYAYPEFRQSSLVSASYRLQTGGSSYVPAGATIEYYYEFTDSIGRRSRTESAVVEYLDPRYEWRTVRTENLLVTYHDRAEQNVLAAARIVDRRLAGVKDLLGLETTRPVKAVILNGRQEARRTFPFVSQTAHDSHLFGGFAYGEYGLFLLGGLDPDGMTHEAVHVMVHEALDSPYLKMPAWLNEGLAMYFEPEGRHSNSPLARAVHSGDAPPLRFMHSIPGRPAEVSLFYAQARNVVTFLIDELGRDRMSALLREIGDGEEIDEAVRGAYGIGLDELDDRWRSWVVGRRAQTNVTGVSERELELSSEGDSQTPTLEAYGATDVFELASGISGGSAVVTERPETDVAAGSPRVVERRAWWPFIAVGGALVAAVVFAAALRLRKN